jgi:hypothetical protein
MHIDKQLFFVLYALPTGLAFLSNVTYNNEIYVDGTFKATSKNIK